MNTRHAFLPSLLAPLLVAALLLPEVQAQNILAEINRVTARDVQADGFVLPSAGEVQIEVAVPLVRSGSYPLGDAWIMNARTREVIWTLDTDNYEERNNKRSIRRTLSLPAGAYEVYFASFPLRNQFEDYNHISWSDTRHIGDVVQNVIDEIFGDNDSKRHSWRDWNDWENAYRGRDARDYGIKLRGNGARESNVDRLAELFAENTLFTLTNLRDNTYRQQGFRLAQPTELDIYAIGELRRDEDERFDFAWIIDTDTGERVWEMDYRNTEPAGGASKNRVANKLLHLDAGSYAAFYVTDDSHAFGEWNSAPPYDPAFWGLTVLSADPAARATVSLFDYEHNTAKGAIVALRNMRDDAYESKGFSLKRPMEVRIYALGEGSGGDMYDYGWLENARTGERVWKMDYRDTEPAGGASKNRSFDGVISLPAGDFVAHYVTDDSHAYGDWNSAPPYDQAAWGLTILPTGTYDRSDFGTYDKEKDPSTIARLAPVRDHAHKRQRFSLDRDTAVRITALGEGSGGDMYDYGWIEDAETGRVVWEMTYRMTDHGGGASKNRHLSTVLNLRRGEYILHYRTDGSHAFGDWNASRPHNPAEWGITLRKAE